MSPVASNLSCLTCIVPGWDLLAPLYLHLLASLHTEYILVVVVDCARSHRGIVLMCDAHERVGAVDPDVLMAEHAGCPACDSAALSHQLRLGMQMEGAKAGNGPGAEVRRVLQGVAGGQRPS